MRSSLIIGASVATVIAAGASADITGAFTVDYTTTVEDFGGTMVTVNVSDLYLTSDDAADVALNVYNLQLVAAGQVNYFPECDRYRLAAQQLGWHLQYRSAAAR